MMIVKKLTRKNKMLLGVCGGLGDYFNLDPLLFRLGFVISVVFFGFGILLYIIMALLVPSEEAL